MGFIIYTLDRRENVMENKETEIEENKIREGKIERESKRMIGSEREINIWGREGERNGEEEREREKEWEW